MKPAFPLQPGPPGSGSEIGLQYLADLLENLFDSLPRRGDPETWSLDHKHNRKIMFLAGRAFLATPNLFLNKFELFTIQT